MPGFIGRVSHMEDEKRLPTRRSWQRDGIQQVIHIPKIVRRPSGRHFLFRFMSRYVCGIYDMPMQGERRMSA
jgi:hypothetical protein